MTKIQIIIDDGESLKGITCNSLDIEELLPEDQGWFLSTPQRRFGTHIFTANNVIFDNSPNLISIPDELLLRIRDYNIDVAHLDALKETYELKEKIVSLKDQVRGWELRRDLAIEEHDRYHEKIMQIIDKYPRVAAEIALEDHNLEAACYYAQKANEEEEENEFKED